MSGYLQLWWVEPNIGGADAASWRTNTFCMSYIDCLNFFKSNLQCWRACQNNI